MATRSPNAGEQTGEVHGDIKPEVHTPRGKAVERTGLTLRSASQEDTEMRRNAHETDSKLSGSFQKAFQKALVLVEKALVLVGWRESPPQPGYKRFRWKNVRQILLVH
jgi:hypothetical protein